MILIKNQTINIQNLYQLKMKYIKTNNWLKIIISSDQVQKYSKEKVKKLEKKQLLNKTLILLMI